MHVLRLCYEGQCSKGWWSGLSLKGSPNNSENDGERGGLGAAVLFEAAELRTAKAMAKAVWALENKKEGQSVSVATSIAELRGPQIGRGLQAAGGGSHHIASLPLPSSRTGSVIMGDFVSAGAFTGSPRKISAGSTSPTHSSRSVSAPTGSVLDSVFSTRRNSVDSMSSLSAAPPILAPPESRPAAGISTVGRIAPLGGGTGGGGGVGVGALDSVTSGGDSLKSKIAEKSTAYRGREDAGSVINSSATSVILTRSASVLAGGEAKSTSIAQILKNSGGNGVTSSRGQIDLSLQSRVSTHANSTLHFNFILPGASSIPFSNDSSAYTSRVIAAHSAASMQLLAHIYNNNNNSDATSAFRLIDGELLEESEDESAAVTYYPVTPLLGTLRDTWSAQGLLGGGGDLCGRLRTLRTFFFASRADWLESFLEISCGELRREIFWGEKGKLSPVSTVTLNRLNSALDLALKTSIAEYDPYRGDVSSELAGHSLLATLEHYESANSLPFPASSHMVEGSESDIWGGNLSFHANPPPPPPPTTMAVSTGAGDGSVKTTSSPPKPLLAYTLFSLSFSAPWPSSVILDPPSLTRYTLLFRHFLLLRTAEAGLNTCWGALQRCKSLRGVRTLLASAHVLRHKMSHFLRSMLFHFTAEVLEPEWREFGIRLRTASNLDTVAAAHARFLSNVFHACFLTLPTRDILKSLTKLTTLCLIFSHQLTGVISDHLLTEEALDKHAGLNRAGTRAKAILERGVFYNNESAEGVGDSVDPTGDAGTAIGSANTAKGGGKQGGRGRSGSTSSFPGPTSQSPPASNSTVLERGRRSLRIMAQSEALRNVLAQAAWQDLIKKSCSLFDSIFSELTVALQARSGEIGCATLLLSITPGIVSY